MLRGLAAFLAIFAELYLPLNLFLVLAGIVIARSANGALHAY